MMFNARKREYVDSDGPVRHLDGSGLARPLNMTRPMLIVTATLMVIAAIIGGVFLYNVLDNAFNSAAKSQASVQENISRPVSLDLPSLPSLFPLGDDAIKQTFADAGYVTYDLASTEPDPSGGFDLLKLPSDMDAAEAGVMYLNGIDSLSAVDASRLLNGSWRMTVRRDEHTDMSVRYVDFNSGSIDAAIQSAIAAEGLDASTFGDRGTDDSGNTYQAGTVDVDGSPCSWQVSAIALSAVYDIEGLPDTAVYVGVRMTP